MGAASEYKKLFNKDYLYTLENDSIIQIYFTHVNFHHLMGLHKLTDIPQVVKSPKNNPTYIFKNIINGLITLDDIKKSKYFEEIESRLQHFSQINRIIEFEKIIIDFDSSLIVSKIDKADYILFKRNNNNMYLNLFLKTDDSNNKKQIPLTFIPCTTDYYTNGQKVINILSMTAAVKRTKRIHQ